jgi:hypothetical protein
MIVSVSVHALLLQLFEEHGAEHVEVSVHLFGRIVDARVVGVDRVTEVLHDEAPSENQEIVRFEGTSGRQSTQAERKEGDHVEAPKLLIPPDFAGEGLQQLASGGRFTFLVAVNKLGLIDSVTLNTYESDSPFNQQLVDELIRRISAARFLAGRKGGSPVRMEFAFTVELKEE